MASSLTSTKEVDYLSEDKPIRGQNYVCLSFLSPEEVLANKEAHYFAKYVSKFASDASVLLEGLRKKYPDDAGLLDTIVDNHSHLLNTSAIQDGFRFFKEHDTGDIEREFHELNNFQTTVRGIKVRGVFDTVQEARNRADLLKRMGDKFDIFVGQVGCWCPWSPNPEDMQDVEYAETQLNTLMKKYTENMSMRDEQYESRKQSKLENARQPSASTSAPAAVDSIGDAVMNANDPETSSAAKATE